MTETVNIAFVGDVSLTGVYRESVIHNREIFSDQLINRFEGYDYVISNLEGPTTDTDNYLRNNGLVVSPKCGIDYLAERNFKIFNLANNHLFDNGLDGFLDTKQELVKNNCSFFGGGETIDEASKTLFIERGDVRFALVGVCHKEGLIADKSKPGIYCIDHNFKKIQDQLTEAKANADWVILNYHGGEEFSTIPQPNRRRLLHRLAKLDADLIIAHHSHVVQGYEYVNSTPIFYSLGNFIFDIIPHANKDLVDIGVILECVFTKNQFEFNFVPTYMNRFDGKIELYNSNFINQIEKYSRFENYFKNWISDAHRAFFHSEKRSGNNSSIAKDNLSVGKRHKSLLSLVFEKDTFIKLFNLLKSPNKRPLFIGAMLYKLLAKVGFK